MALIQQNNMHYTSFFNLYCTKNWHRKGYARIYYYYHSGVRARMPTGRMPTSENCLVRAECRPWLGGMPTGRNADRVQCRIFPLCETAAISILSSTYFLISAYSVGIV